MAQGTIFVISSFRLQPIFAFGEKDEHRPLAPIRLRLACFYWLSRHDVRMSAVQIRKPESKRGVALLQKGFRPFFVLAALHAVVMIPLWITVHQYGARPSEYFLPATWHAHEMVFGFSMAVIAGFLLTAVSNWTQRTTAVGVRLALLCLVWVLGRATPLLAEQLPSPVIAVTSLAFLPLLGFALAGPILGTKNRRNYGILAIIGALFVAQLVSHIGVLREDPIFEFLGPRLGVNLIVILMLVIAGRILPLFTRNATRHEGIRSTPWLDRASVVAALVVTATDVLFIGGVWATLFSSAAAVFALARTRHWGLSVALRTPLLWVLHFGYLFIPLGFALRAISAFAPAVGFSEALHAFTVGGIGTLTLGMMTRVALGHSGRALVAPKSMTAAFFLIIVGALLRIVGPIIGGPLLTASLHTAGTCWAIAFLLYLVRIAPILFQPRPDGASG